MKKREITFPTIFGLLIALGGLVSGLWLLNSQVRLSTQAAAGEQPKNVRVTNITEATFSVSWVTDKAVAGFVMYGEGEAEPDLVVSDERDQQKGAVGEYFTHMVTIRGLKPDTAYKFRIGSGRSLFDQQGRPYATNTGPALATTPPADVTYGNVVTGAGEPAEGAIVYLKLEGGVMQSALVKASGSWVIPLSTTRAESLSDYLKYDAQKARLEILVEGGPMGVAEGVVVTANDSPIPQIVLGQRFDFVHDTKENAKADEESKFSADSLTPPTEVVGGGLAILTPKYGEKVNSLRPQIEGQAPPGTEVVIEINSEQTITGRVRAGSDGRFSFSVPADLDPGEHTVTISAVVNGVTRRITRTFTVYAAGESTVPAFSATPSATLTPAVRLSPTATATATPTTTVTPTARPTNLPTPTTAVPVTPTVKPTATPKPTPVTSLPASGNETPTVLLLGLGLILVIWGAWWYKRA
jgi:hypothetical protein